MADEKDLRTIYVIAGGRLRKIGRARDAQSRLRALRTMSPVPLKLERTCEETSEVCETTLHGLLDARRSHGEWFRLTEGEAAAIVSESGRSRIAELVAMPPRDFGDVLAATLKPTVADAVLRLLNLPDWAFSIMLKWPALKPSKPPSRSKAGRPRLDPASKRTGRLLVKLTAEERELIDAAADGSPTVWARSVLLRAARRTVAESSR